MLRIAAVVLMACTTGATSVVVPQRDAEGRIVRWYNLVTDIDERKRAEELVRTK